ncbi:hypothetical protein Droror1_Dr00025296 [Drosera rotundifolia]
MASSSPTPSPEPQSSGSKALSSLYSNYLFTRLSALISHLNLSLNSSTFLSRISSVWWGRGRRRRKKKPSIPLPVPSKSIDSSMITKETSRIFDVLEDIPEHLFVNLHNVQKNLLFWQSKAEGSDSQRLYFFILERGPGAFLSGTLQLFHTFMSESSSMQQLSHSASAYIVERITILDGLRYRLATFLAQVYLEINRCGDNLVSDPQKTLPLLLATIDALFTTLEASISDLHSSLQLGSSVGEQYFKPMFFKKLPAAKDGHWTDGEVGEAINLVYQNLQGLDFYSSLVVNWYRKPRRMARYWVHYACGTVGLLVCSMWLLRHSSLVGSPDINNWIREAKESTISFWNDHVEQPLLSIRDELFDTFRKRHKGVIDVEEVQLTADSLHRMLLAFAEQTKGQKFPEDVSDQAMLEVVMARYEKELMHPIQNLLGGELARALLIQVQKLKLDIETAMLELDQILKANEINFAILAALPAFFLSLLLLMLVRSWIKQDRGAEGRGKIARIQRRLLIVEVEKKIMQHQLCVDQGQEQDAQCMFGLMLYCLDRLYHAVERHAQATGEWLCLRQDIIELGKPGLPAAYKLTITSRMDRVYDCLLPSPKR